MTTFAPVRFPSVFAVTALILTMALPLAIAPSHALEPNAATVAASDKKRVLYIDSYDPGFEWVQGITEGLLSQLDIQSDAEGHLEQSTSPVQLKILHMDTKRNPSPVFIRSAVAKARAVIEDWQPDVVIASDDNASKYLIAPYYKDSKIPFVFCGLNTKASAYGFPYSNVTGMQEVPLIDDMIKIMEPYTRGGRIGLLAGDAFSHRMDERLAEDHGLTVEGIYVKTFDQWKQSYLNLQIEVDMLIIGVVPNVVGWDATEAIAFVNENTKIPSGSWDEWMMPYSLVGVLKSPQEQGSWAAATALKILDGTPPASIPITANTKARIFLNMRLAKEMGVKFPIELIERATLVSP